jgi:DNA-binding beta-propeller fold protein YncE
VESDGSGPAEVEQKPEPPASGKFYVYVAVPSQDMVAKIHSATQRVRSIKIPGKDPGALRTIPGQDVAVVLARQSAKAVVIRSRSDGGDDLVALTTATDLNSLTIAPDGKHAVAFYDVARSEGKTPANQSFQEVTVLDLTAGQEKSVNLSVGFRPSDVVFSADSKWAYVITEQGVSTVELAKAVKPAIAPTIPLVKDPTTEGKLEEVIVTPDGKHALARRKGLGGIRVVELDTKTITDLDLGGDATDLDLTKDGTLAIVTLRDVGEVALVDIPADLADPTQIEKLSTGGYQAGQSELSLDGKRAFLFTNATNQEVLLIADLTTRKLSVNPLKKAIRSVVGSPDGEVALVLHNKLPGTPSEEDDFETFIDKSHGYSLLKVGTGYDKLVLTPTDPGQVAFAPDSASAYLLLNDLQQGIRAVEAIDLQAFQVDDVTLGSPPAALGVISATKTVYVAQSHPLGRVTFIAMDKDHGTKTVTGFELNSHIIE